MHGPAPRGVPGRLTSKGGDYIESTYSGCVSNLEPGAVPTIAVTGATGRIGGAVAETLRDEGLPLRLLVRDPSRAPQWASAGAAEVAAAPYGDADAAREALVGTHLLLMVSASEAADRLEQHRSLISAAADAGVQHIVYTSFLGASPDATFTFARTHWATEEALRASGIAWTALRDSFYLDFLPDLAVDGVIAGPAGPSGGRVGAVARADVARSAAAILTDLAVGGAAAARHRGAAYDLTGPESLSLVEVARVLTEHGRPAVYKEEAVEEAYASRASYGAPAWEVDGWVSTYTAIASGELAAVTGDVERLTGRPPLSLDQLLRGES